MTDRNRITRRKRITQRWQKQGGIIIVIMEPNGLDSDKMTLLRYSDIQSMNAKYEGEDGMKLEFVMSMRSTQHNHDRIHANITPPTSSVIIHINDPKSFGIAFKELTQDNDYYKIIIREGEFELRTRSITKRPKSANLTKQARKEIKSC